MTEKLVFTDMELDLFQTDSPTTFGNDGKVMVVSDSLMNGNGYLTSKVLAYIPGREYPVVTPTGQYKYCAEIPVGKIRINKYLDHNPMFIRGKVSSIVTLPSSGKTEALCQNAIDACLNSYNVLYITIETSMDAICSRIANMAPNPLRNLKIVQGKPRMTTQDVNALITTCQLEPDVVILDYISLVEPYATSSNPDHRRRTTYFELVDIARKKGISILTAEAVSPV